MEDIILNVDGMMCGGCENRIQNAVSKIEKVEKVVANHESGIVTISAKTGVNIEVIKEKINDLGFEVKE